MRQISQHSCCTSNLKLLTTVIKPPNDYEGNFMKKLLMFAALLLGLAGSANAVSTAISLEDYGNNCCGKKREKMEQACKEFETANQQLNVEICKKVADVKKKAQEERQKLLTDIKQRQLIKPVGMYMNKCCIKKINPADVLRCKLSKALYPRSDAPCARKIRLSR